MPEYQITIEWDEEAQCWCASGEDQDENFGVALDAGSLDALIEKVKIVIWDLTGNPHFKIQFKMERFVEAAFG